MWLRPKWEDIDQQIKRTLKSICLFFGCRVANQMLCKLSLVIIITNSLPNEHFTKTRRLLSIHPHFDIVTNIAQYIVWADSCWDAHLISPCVGQLLVKDRLTLHRHTVGRLIRTPSTDCRHIGSKMVTDYWPTRKDSQSTAGQLINQQSIDSRLRVDRCYLTVY